MTTYKKTLKSGKISWYCIFYYKDAQGVRHQKKKEGFRLERDARQYERDFVAKYEKSSAAPFRVVAEDFLEDTAQRDRAENTIISYRMVINRHLLPVFGNMPISEITPLDVINWQKADKGNSTAYYHIILTGIFRHAMRFFGLKANPASTAGTGNARQDREKEKKSMQFWTLGQFRQFYGALPAKDKLYHALFSLLFFSGCRIGEALALTPADINGNIISITKNLSRAKVGRTKTDTANRQVIVPDIVTDNIASWLQSIGPYQDNTLIFPRTSSSVRKQLSRTAAEAGLPVIRVHDLRHSHASYLINKGYSLQVIKERLGHRDIATTINIYAHLYPSKQEDIAKDLQAEFTGEK